MADAPRRGRAGGGIPGAVAGRAEGGRSMKRMGDLLGRIEEMREQAKAQKIERDNSPSVSR